MATSNQKNSDSLATVSVKTEKLPSGKTSSGKEKVPSGKKTVKTKTPTVEVDIESENGKPTRISAKAVAKKGSKKKEEAPKKEPKKFTANNRKIASKGQTKEEQIAKKTAFNRQRAVWFDQYMRDELPGLYELRISTDRNTLLSDDQATRLAEFIQAGLAAKVMSNRVVTLTGDEKPVHLQKTIAPGADQIIEFLSDYGYTPEIYISDKDARRKLNKLRDQAEEARLIFAEKNLGLVPMMAGRLKKRSNAAGGVDFDDLLAEGMNGLMVAIDHFNPAMGFKFSTHAGWWIDQPIRGYLDSKTKMIHMPTHMNNRFRDIEYAKSALRDAHPEMPDDSFITNEMIAEYCQSKGYDLTVEQIEEAQLLRRETISLDRPISDGSGSDKDMNEVISSDEDITIDVMDRIGGRDNFNRMLALIDDDKKREIMRDWYSSQDMHDQIILSNVSRKHCLTKERVRQLKQEAERELQQKISDIAKERGVAPGEAIMLADDRYGEPDVEIEVFIA